MAKKKADKKFEMKTSTMWVLLLAFFVLVVALVLSNQNLNVTETQTTTTTVYVTTTTAPCSVNFSPILVRGVIRDIKLIYDKTLGYTSYNFDIVLMSQNSYSVYVRAEGKGLNYQDNDLVTVNGTLSTFASGQCDEKITDIVGKILTSAEEDAMLRTGVYPIS